MLFLQSKTNKIWCQWLTSCSIWIKVQVSSLGSCSSATPTPSVSVNPCKMWLIKRPGVKWPMLCQREKPELEVRPVQLARSRHLSQTHSKWHAVCLALPLSARGPRSFSPTPTPISVGLCTHAYTHTHRKSMQEVPHHCAASISQSFSQNSNDRNVFPSWMSSSLIVNKISLPAVSHAPAHTERNTLIAVQTPPNRGCLILFTFVRHPGVLSAAKPLLCSHMYCISKLHNKP